MINPALFSFFTTSLILDDIEYALETLVNEKEYERQVKLVGVSKTIPNFVKVLYRYFHKV